MNRTISDDAAPIRVLLVDDEQLVCRYLAQILGAESDITVVGMEFDGAAAVDAAVRLSPDVILMDLRMPGVDGLTALRRIRTLNLPSQVVALTVFDTDATVLGAMRAGAAGVLLKSTAPGDLVNLIRVAAQGQTVLSPSAAARLVAAGGDQHRAEETRKMLAALTDREREVLALLGGGHSNAEIGQRLTLTEATIKGYVSQVLAKLGCENRTQAGLLAQSAGLPGS